MSIGFFFKEGGVQSSLTVMGGHRWSYSIETRRKERDKVVCMHG